MNWRAHNLAKAVLLFHGATQWGEAERMAWIRLTGRGEASTRVLGDMARELLTYIADRELEDERE